jgi:hypothetical protein
MTDKNKLAFPIQDAYSMSTEQGMTLRDYFAAKAMVGLLNCYHNPKEFTEEKLAEQSYEVADAMMKAREK